MVKKRVLYIGGFELPDKNAAAQRVMSNALLLRTLGFMISFIGVARNGNPKEEINGFKCKYIQYPSSIKEWMYHTLVFLSLYEIANESPDYIILYNFPAIPSLRIIKYAHKHRIKVIHDLTEWEESIWRTPRDVIKNIDTSLRMRYCMKRMDGVIAISKYLYNYYKDDVNTILIPPTVDIESPKWNRNRELTSGTPIKLVYAGSPGGKGKDRLDLIVDEVKKSNRFHLVVVGLNEAQYYNSYHKGKELTKNVEFKGRLSHKEAIQLVCESDFQVIIRENSKKNKAGFPTKLVESITCGIPVIATVFSNIEDYIKDGINGFLIKKNSCLEDVFKKISGISSEEIIKMKQNCIDMNVFDYKFYQTEFRKIFK